MKSLLSAFLVLVALFAGGAWAQEADPPAFLDPDNLVVAEVDLSEQTMRLYVEGRLRYIWWVSTGLGVYRTPTGEWRPYWLSPNHRSSKYDNAPMPWSVFYYRGYAIHGTTAVALLGQPASHGCIRLHPDNAEIFFRLVEEYGLARSLVVVVE